MKITLPINPESTSPHREALVFVLATVVASWLFWIPGSILAIVAPSAASDAILAFGSFAPLAVALFLDSWLKRRSFKIRDWTGTIKLGTIGLAVLLPLCWFAPVFLVLFVQGQIEVGSLMDAFLSSLPWSLGLFVIGLGEEAGWRGYLLPRLGDLSTYLVNPLVALLWFGWLLPLILFRPFNAFPGSSGDIFSVLLFALLITPFFNRLARRAHYNVILPALARGSLGITLWLLASVTSGIADAEPFNWLVLGWLFLLNIILFSQLWLGRKPPSEVSELERVMPLQVTQ